MIDFFDLKGRGDVKYKIVDYGIYKNQEEDKTEDDRKVITKLEIVNETTTFIEEQNPEKNVMNSLPKVATDELKKLLKKLVKNEDYEAAAKVRDELSKRGENDE